MKTINETIDKTSKLQSFMLVSSNTIKDLKSKSASNECRGLRLHL